MLTRPYLGEGHNNKEPCDALLPVAFDRTGKDRCSGGYTLVWVAVATASENWKRRPGQMEKLGRRIAEEKKTERARACQRPYRRHAHGISVELALPTAGDCNRDAARLSWGEVDPKLFEPPSENLLQTSTRKDLASKSWNQNFSSSTSSPLFECGAGCFLRGGTRAAGDAGVVGAAARRHSRGNTSRNY